MNSKKTQGKEAIPKTDVKVLKPQKKVSGGRVKSAPAPKQQRQPAIPSFRARIVPYTLQLAHSPNVQKTVAEAARPLGLPEDDWRDSPNYHHNDADDMDQWDSNHLEPPTRKPKILDEGEGGNGVPFGDNKIWSQKDLDELYSFLKERNESVHPLSLFGLDADAWLHLISDAIAGVAGAKEMLRRHSRGLPPRVLTKIEHALRISPDSIPGLIRRAPQALVSSTSLIGGRTATLKGINDSVYGPGLSSEFKLPIGLVRNVLGALSVTAYGTAVWSSGKLLIGPDAMGGRMAVFGSLFSRWKLEHIRFIYSPGCPATTPGTIAWGILDDPSATTAAIGNVEGVMQLCPSQMVSAWSPMEIQTPSRKEWFYTESTSADASDEKRFTDAGTLIVVATGLDAAVTTYLGTIEICATLTYAGPTPDSGITMACDVKRTLGQKNFELFMSVLNSDRALLFKALSAVGLSNDQVKASDLIQRADQQKLELAIESLARKASTRT